MNTASCHRPKLGLIGKDVNISRSFTFLTESVGDVQRHLTLVLWSGGPSSGPVFCLLNKFRLCSANHRAGYFSNLACDWLSIVWAYSEQETENGPWSCWKSACLFKPNPFLIKIPTLNICFLRVAEMTRFPLVVRLLWAIKINLMLENWS